MAYTYERYANAMEYSEKSQSKSKTKKEMCLEYIERYGSITPLEALTAFNSFRLAALICELRKDGYAIDMKLNEHEPRFAIYSLRKEGDEHDG